MVDRFLDVLLFDPYVKNSNTKDDKYGRKGTMLKLEKLPHFPVAKENRDEPIHRSANLRHFLNKCKDLSARLKRWRSLNIANQGDVKEHDFLKAQSSQERKIADDTLRNITLEAITFVQEKIYDKFIAGTYPTSDTLETLYQDAIAQNANKTSKKNQEYRRSFKDKITDPQRSHANYYKHLRSDYQSPTSVMQDPADDTLTANISKIMIIMKEAWETVFQRLKEQPPCWNTFHAEFSGAFEGIPEAGDLTPSDQDMFDQSQRAKDHGASGMDGRWPSELKRLPLFA